MVRVLVIGLDGGTWRVFDPLVKAGVMPNLGRLASSGVKGILRSTIPYVTAPAWATFQTGVNPGKHGVFDFQEFDRESGRGLITSRLSIRCPRFWDILSQRGKRVAVLFVPMTYPPARVNGVMVSGLLTPTANSVFAYPRGLAARLNRRFGPYRIYHPKPISSYKNPVQEVVSENIDATDYYVSVGDYVFRQESWDLAILHILSPDLVQHRLWPVVESLAEANNQASESAREAVRRFYSHLDEALGRALAHLHPEGLVVVMSDHGFVPFHKLFNINVWLQERGYLVVGESSKLTRSLGKLFRSFKRLDFLALRHRSWAMRAPKLRALSHIGEVPLTVDFLASQAFAASGGICPGIYLLGEKIQVTRKRLCQELLSWRDPAAKTPVVKRIHDARELYSGPYLDRMPDLVVELASGYEPGLTLAGDAILEPTHRLHQGSHAREGMFIAWGKEVASSPKSIELDMVDLAPTLLRLFDIPVPAYMDGKALELRRRGP